MRSRPLHPLIAPLKIQPKGRGLITLGGNLTYPQKRLLDSIEDDITHRRPVRYIILKARQMGMSTLVEAILFTMAMTLRGSQSKVISHETDSAKHLLDMTRRYWETSWINKRGIYTPKHMATNHLAWVEPESSLHVATAKNIGTGRSYTIHGLHASEVASWGDAETLMSGLNPSMPRLPLTFQFIESTAKGVGNYFNEQWLAAEAGEVAYKPVFYPWWQHTEYTADHIGVGYRADMPLGKMDSNERLLDRAFRRLGMDARERRSRLIWRRETLATECRGDIDFFREEYPATPEEAFVATGNNVFTKPSLDAAYEPEDGEYGRLTRDHGTGRVRFQRDANGEFCVWRRPDPNRVHGWYMVGGDPSKQAQGDYACIQVVNRKTWEQVAEYRARGIDPVTFAEQMMMVGEYFNDAMLVPETNMSGGAVAEIVRSQYVNVFVHKAMAKVRGQMENQYGWNTNVQTKPEALGNMQRSLQDRARGQSTVTIRSRHLYREALNYVVSEAGKYQNGNGEEHDDTVMAFAIALTATIYEAASGAQNHTGRSSPRSSDMPANQLPAGQALAYAAADNVGAVQGATAGKSATNPDDEQSFSIPVPPISPTPPWEGWGEPTVEENAW